jgi:glucose/arabinose dehydrogenase
MTLRSSLCILVSAAALAACAQGRAADAGQTAARRTPEATAGTPRAPDPEAPVAEQPCPPVETREPNAAGQRPAFPGQTRTCAVRSEVAFDVVVLARGLEHPWAVEPLPGGDLLVTERPGRMRIVSAAGDVGPPIAGLPRVQSTRQGGLLDVALGPAFDSDRTVFWSFTEPREGGNGTSVARGVLSADGGRLDDVRVIFRSRPTYDGELHFGSRLVFGPDGMLYVTMGERSVEEMRPYAQRLDSHLGKTLRIRPDGSPPPDNPFVGEGEALPEIWTVGHRNVQAAAFDQEGRLWEVEHGTNGGDELNLIERGKNYGWPKQAYGEEYSGEPIPGAQTAPPGFQQPVYYWDPVIAPSGALFYQGQRFPRWRGDLLVGSLQPGGLVRLRLADTRVAAEERYQLEPNERIRDVRQGPDGLIYLLTDNSRGRIVRLEPER